MWAALADVLPYTTGLVMTAFALIAVIVLLVLTIGTVRGVGPLEPAIRRRAALEHSRRWLVENLEPLTIVTTLIFARLFISKGPRGML